MCEKEKSSCVLLCSDARQKYNEIKSKNTGLLIFSEKKKRDYKGSSVWEDSVTREQSKELLLIKTQKARERVIWIIAEGCGSTLTSDALIKRFFDFMLLLLLLLFFFFFSLMLVQYVKKKKTHCRSLHRSSASLWEHTKKKIVARTCQREKERSEMTTRAESQHTNRHNEI